MNEHENCAMWARNGECPKNPDYMMATCRLSCGNCVQDAEQAAADEEEDDYEEHEKKYAEKQVNPFCNLKKSIEVTYYSFVNHLAKSRWSSCCLISLLYLFFLAFCNLSAL
jgi:hypothetical protein